MADIDFGAVVGPVGPQGPKGDTGATGPQGPKGDKGDDGTFSPEDLQRIADLEAENAALREYLRSMVIYRTASGNPATFNDGYAANVKALSVTIAPSQSGSGDPSPDNIRPISGAASVNVTRTGKNLLKFTDTAAYVRNGITVSVKDGIITISGEPTINTNAVLDTNISNLPPGDYIVTNHASPTHGWYIYNLTTKTDSAKTGHPAFSYNGTDNLSFRLGVFYPGNTYSVTYKIMLRRADVTDDAYEPYQGQSVAVPLVDSNSDPLTVYGGTLNAATGELAVTWANIASYAGETLPGRWISDRDVYAPGATPTTGAQVAYELATPVTYQLTPAQLATLSGYNAVFTDADALSVEYRADPTMTLGG